MFFVCRKITLSKNPNEKYTYIKNRLLHRCMSPECMGLFLSELHFIGPFGAITYKYVAIAVSGAKISCAKLLSCVEQKIKYPDSQI
jgi:hypothetical protein